MVHEENQNIALNTILTSDLAFLLPSLLLSSPGRLIPKMFTKSI